MQQRRLLEDIFDSLTDLVVVVDNHLRVVQMNGTFAARAAGRGRRRAEPNQMLDTLVGADMAAWVADGEEEGAQEAGARSRQFIDERLDGTFAVTVTPLINQDDDPVGRVVVARDITRQVRLEAEREGLRQRLAQSEKLASLGQFVAGIAHEINNPLQGILGHLELLIGGADLARPVKSTLRQIYQEGDRAAKIVRNLLVFTGSRQMNRRKVRVERIVARSLASRRAALARAHIEVTREIDPDVPSVVGDAPLLQQAFLNVLINAEHAAAGRNSDGRITVSIGRTRAGSVRVAISDNGPGIPADVLPRIFDPFFTTKDVGRGTGLGLTITYGIVQEHHGTIVAANLPEGGAQFTIELPAAD
jgi:signal transduction histidine kinase